MRPRRVLRRLTPARLRGPALVSLTFDDGTADHRDAGRVLAAHGLAGTFFVNSNRVGSGPERLGWDDVAELAASGHEIGGHTADHVDLASATRAEAQAQIESDRRALLERGHDVRSFAYPYGSLSDTARACVAEAGYRSARRAWGLAGVGEAAASATESVPPLDPFAIRTVPSLEAPTTLDDLRRLVVRAESEGGWLPLVFHGLSGEGRYDVSAEVFRGFVAWLAGRRGIRVRLLGNVVGTS